MQTDVKLSTKQNSGIVFLFTVLLASLSLNVVLAWRTRTDSVRVAGVPIGMNVKQLNLITVAGQKHSIRLDDGRPTMIYILSPSCVWCGRNLDSIRIVAGAAAPKYRVIGISNTSTKLAEYITTTRLPFPVEVADRAGLPPGFDVSATPQTILVNQFGVVERSWGGAFMGTKKPELEEFFRIKLPEIQAGS